jgi:hypothetical protein
LSVFQNRNQVLIGIVVILLGAILYATDRPPWQIPWLPDHFNLYHLTPQYFGRIGNSLPSFLHQFGFSLLTAGIIAQRGSSYRTICGLWAATNVSFELFQANNIIKMTSQISSHLENSNRIFTYLQTYSSTAVFDFFDILAIICGAICAYYVLLLTQESRSSHEQGI